MNDVSKSLLKSCQNYRRKDDRQLCDCSRTIMSLSSDDARASGGGCRKGCR